ncbi:RNA 3'-terminal phosphate cyclase [Leguminivora glycinivorella]|uniref:RNA 3'-terminal phosphate cyclase n=1 Tax=Leguminivora glycinivorella TaxID=1035111 RepID=UPI00200FA5CC|nr:RNA 3'-terminal phosphate cyclase [Leguminivora glycinivorella]
MSEFIDIDGSILEGGGQILRLSISLSAILGIPVRISKIRAGRSKPGLAAQHCKGILLVAEMCHAKTKGAEVGSTEVEFSPKMIRGGQYFADPQTAGSISLLLQVSLPCALMADGPVTFDFRGGTNADMAPQIDYMDKVFRHALRQFGADFGMTIHRRGYFPKGGGAVTINVNPVRSFRSVTLTDPGSVNRVTGTSFVAGVLPISMAQQMAEGAKQELRSVAETTINCYKEDSRIAIGNCNGMLLTCTTSTGHVLGSDALGRRGAEARAAGADAARRLRADIDAGACLDQYCQDQVILFMALAEGTSSVTVGEVTLHTRTAIHIAEMLAKVKFEIHPHGSQNTIECTGLGLINNNLPT